MAKIYCDECNQKVESNNMLECPECGTTVCELCANEDRTCPDCDNSLEFWLKLHKKRKEIKW